MKKNLLVILIIFVASGFSFAQLSKKEAKTNLVQDLLKSGLNDVNLIKIESFNYNLALFSPDEYQQATAPDSIKEMESTFEYESNKVTSYSKYWYVDEDEEEIKSISYFRDAESLDSMVVFNKNDESQWVRAMKMVFEYENGKNTKDLTYIADSLTQAWELFMEIGFTYNNDGALVKEETSMLDEDEEEMVLFSQEEYFISANGLVDSSLFSIKIPEMGWLGNSKVHFFYINGVLDHEISYTTSFFTTTWEKSDKISYVYNAQGNIIEENYYTWEIGSSDWEIYEKDATIYAEGVRPLVNIYYELPPDDEPPMAISSKTYYTYDGSNQVEDLLKENLFVVYPNPVSDFLIIKQNLPGTASLELYDLKGKLVLKKELYSNTSTLPVQHLLKGSYLLKIRSNEQTQTQVILIK